MNAPLIAVLPGTLVAAAIDARTGRIPDVVSVTTAAIVLFASVLAGTLGAALAGAICAGAALLLLHVATRGRGLGLGDVKLAVAIGAALGTTSGLVALGIAFVAGAAYGVVLLVLGRAGRRSALPFAPFLALGTAVAAVRWA
jgi:leader peptidase (prepilin peptidase)/N-methyltransferase